MGQAAGIKRRKGRVGNYNVLKNRKSGVIKKRALHKSGLKFLGLEDDVGKQCLLTRIEQAGLVADLRKFHKPDRDTSMKGPGVSRLEQLKAVPKYAKQQKETSDVIKTVTDKRNEAKKRAFSRRDIRVPKTQAKRMTYFLDKYGEDYQAMVGDPMNYDQYTWKQFRVQVQSFKSTTTQFAEYLADRGLFNAPPEKEETNKARAPKKAKEAKPTDEQDDDDDESDGENGQNFMAKVRAMEGINNEESDDDEDDDSDNESERDSESEKDIESGSEVLEDGSLPSALSANEKQRQTKRRLRAKNFKVAKLKKLNKVKRKLGLKK